MIDSVELERIDAAEIAVESTPPDARKRTGSVLIGLSLLFLVTVFLSVGLFGIRTAVIAGGSMEPRWHRGDVVITRSVDHGHLEVGNVITYGVGGTRVLHRITEIQETDQGRVFITRGDNNPTADLPVPAEHVEGKVVRTVPALGRPLLLVRSWMAGLP